MIKNLTQYSTNCGATYERVVELLALDDSPELPDDGAPDSSDNTAQRSRRYKRKAPVTEMDLRLAFRRITLTSKLLSGTVKWYNTAKGYGFVMSGNRGKDLMFLVKELDRSGINSKSLDGQRVSFDIKMSSTGKRRATNLMLLISGSVV